MESHVVFLTEARVCHSFIMWPRALATGDSVMMKANGPYAWRSAWWPTKPIHDAFASCHAGSLVPVEGWDGEPPGLGATCCGQRRRCHACKYLTCLHIIAPALICRFIIGHQAVPQAMARIMTYLLYT
jgi:hypothetical protein